MDYVVVGLGNPGKEYSLSRHNVGFLSIDILCERLNISLKKETSNSLGVSGLIAGKKVLIAKPTTYMNDSGVAVGEILRRYKLEPSQLIVIHDELDLDFGTVRCKVGGGLAGHNGLRSIKQHLKSDEFIRIRIGVGKPIHKSQGANHVLKSMSKKDLELINISCEKAVDAVELIVSESLTSAMNTIHTD